MNSDFWNSTMFSTAEIERLEQLMTRDDDDVQFLLKMCEEIFSEFTKVDAELNTLRTLVEEVAHD